MSSAKAIQMANNKAMNAYMRPGLQEGGGLKSGLKTFRKAAGVASKIGRVGGKVLKVGGVLTGQPELVAAGEQISLGSKGLKKGSKGLKKAGFGRGKKQTGGRMTGKQIIASKIKPKPRLPIRGRLTTNR